jgi:bla regulator protein blaR1
MTDLAMYLGKMFGFLSEPGDVIDKTGLTGEFDFRLKYERPRIYVNPAAAAAAAASGQRADDTPSGVPAIFAAVEQQLGLRLKAVKTMSDVLVIDHAEKEPVEN